MSDAALPKLLGALGLMKPSPQKTLRAWKVEPSGYLQTVSSFTGLHESIVMLAMVEVDNDIDLPCKQLTKHAHTFEY
jgi:hypothetical protein